ncbi:helix-turn-helix domain-containing protein [Vagococcus bubulae]|uniref:helix-turn-helix domain-containing protein n=1 Tax=Vagococcus bubulae TaxID=1977868 RepID=UPI0022DEC379|nr:helix-turn-helix transcriptional regulator [Vagococcus bubulae]
MKISYKPLWKLMIDKEIKQKDLKNGARLSSSTIQKLRNNENVTTDVLLRICNFLDCDLSDIAECIKEN